MKEWHEKVRKLFITQNSFKQKQYENTNTTSNNETEKNKQ